MSNDDEITSEEVRRAKASLCNLGPKASIEVVRKPRSAKAARPLPHVQIFASRDHDEDCWRFMLVSADMRQEIGCEYDRRDAQKLRNKLEVMGLKVDWIL